MPFENLFIRTQRSIGGIELDAVLSEGHNSTIRLTKNPVEFGAEITDHSIIEPKKINIVAEVSDTPLGLAAFGQIVDTITGLFGTSTVESITRSNAAYGAMILLQEAREPLEIQTKLKLYQDMIITNISTVQDKDTSRIVRMIIDLEEILIVQSELVELEASQLQDGSPKEQGSPPVQDGRKEPVTPDSNTNKSVLKSVADWIRE